MSRTLISALIAGTFIIIAVVVVVINNRTPDRTPDEIRANTAAYKTKTITVGNKYQN